MDLSSLYNRTYARLVSKAALDWPVIPNAKTPEEMAWGEADDVAYIEGTLIEAHATATQHCERVAAVHNQRVASLGEPMWAEHAIRPVHRTMTQHWKFEAAMRALYTVPVAK